MFRAWKCLAVCGALLAVCAQSPSAAERKAQSRPAAAAHASSGSGWIANGATACDTFLTPEVVGEIFKNPAGQRKKLSAQACRFTTPDFASISITLTQAGPAVFDAHMKYLDSPVALSGVGDKAVRSATGIEAVKGADRMCKISVTPPFGNKISGEPLARKFGDVCNKLFALP